MGDLRGKILTVKGPIEPEKLGITLTHEHLFCDSSNRFEEPASSEEQDLAYSPICLENMWWLKRHQSYNLDNLCLNNYEDAISEVRRFKAKGGGTIVDVSSKGLSIDPLSVRRLSNEVGLNVVLGTGYYVSKTHPSNLAEKTVDSISKELKFDILKGLDGTDVRAGILGGIGVAGTHWEKELVIHKDEEKVLRAAARAQIDTGVAISVHPPRKKDESHPSSKWGLDILEILREEGAILNKVVICHMDGYAFTDLNLKYQVEITKKGAYVEYDLWGQEHYVERLPWYSAPSDTQRTEAVQKMVKAGCLKRLLFSQDIYTKMQLTKYGGFGYDHLQRNCVPMLLRFGLTDAHLQTIFIENPKRVLQIV